MNEIPPAAAIHRLQHDGVGRARACPRHTGKSRQFRGKLLVLTIGIDHCWIEATQ
jgi:hypothetical protein